MTPSRVLMVNHTGQVSGAEHSLLALMAGLRACELSCTLACPFDGPLASIARTAGCEVREITGTEGNLRLHPTRTAKAVGEIALTALQVARLAHVIGADIVHANSLRASLSAGVGAKGAGVPAIAHLRDRLPPGATSTACLRVIDATCAGVIANSSFTGAALQEAGISRPATVISNPVDLDRFRPCSETERDSIRAQLGIARETVALGVVGQITRWKGQATAIETVRRLVSEFPNVQLLIVGEAKFLHPSSRHDNASYMEQLQRAAQDPTVDGRVSFLGERRDVPDVMRALDVLLLPSIGEPFGRVIIEAMAVGTPIVASADGGPREIIEDTVTGMLVDPPDLEAWAAAVRLLITNRELRRDIIATARRCSEQYSIGRHAEQVIDVYRRASGKDASAYPMSLAA
jgi:glycosyltransferase involved in cell wall biosynthesis